MSSQMTALYTSSLPRTATNYADYASGQALPTSIDAGGIVKAISDTYLTTSAITTAQTLALCKIPIGAKVLAILIHVAAGSGPSGASKLGVATIDSAGAITVTDDDRYGTVTNINAAAGTYVAQAATASDFDQVPTSELALVFTPVGASLGNAVTIGFTVFYVTV